MSDPWAMVLVTHQAAVDRLPASIRGDFQEPGPWDAVKACGISVESMEKALELPRREFAIGGVIRPWFAPGTADMTQPTRAEIAAGVRR